VPFNFVDCDPYGSPWEIIATFFASDRERAARLVIAVQDGLRLNARLTGGWDVAVLRAGVNEFGANGLFDNYLAFCESNLRAIAGYELTRWAGYYCGRGQSMTHYAGVLVRSGG